MLKFLFQQIITDAALENISASVNKASREYFIDKAKKLDNQRPNRILNRQGIKDNLQSEMPIRPGDIFLFNYHPKNADNVKKLPFYDRYPVILLLDIQPGVYLRIKFSLLALYGKSFIIRPTVQTFTNR